MSEGNAEAHRGDVSDIKSEIDGVKSRLDEAISDMVSNMNRINEERDLAEMEMADDAYEGANFGNREPTKVFQTERGVGQMTPRSANAIQSYITHKS